MKLFQLKTEVCKFDNFKELVVYFHIGEGDLIFSSESIYRAFISPLNLKADIILKGTYGQGEPTDEMINSIMKDVEGKNYKRIVAVGGGAVIDIAKLLVIKGAKNTLDLFEKRIPFVKDKELIAVPTTCGAGSEVSNISIAEIKEKNTKLGLAVNELFPDYAALIPALLEKLPYKFFVTSSIDALIHAIESYVSPKSNSYTELFSIKAIQLILNGYMEMLKKGEGYRNEIIGEFLMASNYAGVAFSNTGTGAVHALSYPLSGTYHVTHGEANYQMFVEVLKTYDKKKPEGKIKDINRVLAATLHCEPTVVYEELTSVLDKLLARKPLKDYGMKVEEIIEFTDSVIEGQQRLLINSYVPLTREDILSIYKNLY